jgi:LAS superfamily LD-carboxypeptidase LdcB
MFGAGSSHMEGVTSTGKDVTLKINGTGQITPLHTADCTKYPSTGMNIFAQRCIAFSSVCDWNLIQSADNHPYSEQAYATNATWNLKTAHFYFALKTRY